MFLNFEEMINGESRHLILELLNDTFNMIDNNYDFLIYDDACHLSESLKKHEKRYPRLKNTKLYIDRFHLGNHVRKICHTKFNINNEISLYEINTQICEQQFSKLNRYKHMVKHMSEYHFNLFFLCVLENRNEILLKSLKNKIR